jgi:hypothetical protein
MKCGDFTIRGRTVRGVDHLKLSKDSKDKLASWLNGRNTGNVVEVCYIGSGDPLDLGQHIARSIAADSLSEYVLKPASGAWSVGEVRDKILPALSTEGRERTGVVILEANTLSSSGSDMLLVPLEKPPARTRVVLLTTSVDSIPVALAGRCLGRVLLTEYGTETPWYAVERHARTSHTSDVDGWNRIADDWLTGSTDPGVLIHVYDELAKGLPKEKSLDPWCSLLEAVASRCGRRNSLENAARAGRATSLLSASKGAGLNQVSVLLTANLMLSP